LTIGTKEEHDPGNVGQSNEPRNRLGLAATDEAACGGDARQAVAALIVASEFLEAQVRDLQAAVSNGYARGKFEPVPRDRKDWYD
jgi:hypothetical protein